MILPSSYFAPIVQYALIAQGNSYAIESKENFVKQSFRSRCEIAAANGKLSLVVPLKKRKNHTPIEEVEVSYAEGWQKLHWRSIESAYRGSPYFEFYEDEIRPLVFLETNLLLERNEQIERELKEILRINSKATRTSDYQSQSMDWRNIIHPKNKLDTMGVNFPKYIQVFEEKHGFIPNLSILDLLFNLGPDCKTYLEKLTIKP